MAITLVQQTSALDTSGGNNGVSVAFSTAPTAGNMLYAVIGSGNGSSNANLTGFSDTNSNTWTKVVDLNTNMGNGTQVWVAYNCRGGATTVSVTDGFFATALAIGEVSGLATSAAFDQTSSVDVTGANPSGTATSTLSSASEFVLAVACAGPHNGTAYTVGSGYSNFIAQAGQFVDFGIQSKTVSSTAAVNTAFGGGSTGVVVTKVTIATFKAASGAATQTITTTGIGSAVAVGSVSLTSSKTLSLTGVASTAHVGGPTISPGSVSRTITGISSTLSIGSVSVASVSPLSVTGIASTTMIGSPGLAPGSVSVTPSGIASSAVIGSVAISGLVTMSVSGVPSTMALGSVQVSSSNSIAITGIASTSTLGSVGVAVQGPSISVSGIASSISLGTPTIVIPQVLSVNGIASAVTFGALELTKQSFIQQTKIVLQLSKPSIIPITLQKQTMLINGSEAPTVRILVSKPAPVALTIPKPSPQTIAVAKQPASPILITRPVSAVGVNVA